MNIFKNYIDEDCILTDEQEKHISLRHPDATILLISKCLKEPIEVRKSGYSNISQLYFNNENWRDYIQEGSLVCISTMTKT